MTHTLLSTATRYFMAVAHAGSITEAAQTLHVAPSAVSRQVVKLEDSLGSALFKRQARGMALTEAGERLAAWVHRTQQETTHVAQQVRGLADQRSKRIHVACTEGFAAGFMPHVMLSFRARYPQAIIHLWVGDSEDVSRWLLRGDCELGLKYAVSPEKGLKLVHGRPSSIVAVFAPTHELAQQRRLSLAQLMRYPLALPHAQASIRQVFDTACARQGLHYEEVFSGNWPALLALAMSGQVVALATDLSVAHAVAGAALQTLTVEQTAFGQRYAQLLMPQELSPTMMLEDFVAHVCTALDQGTPAPGLPASAKRSRTAKKR